MSDVVTTPFGFESTAADVIAGVDLSGKSAIVTGASSGPLDILVNNAGVMAVPELTMSPSGREMQFATNHLGRFVLTVGLHDALAAAGDARVVSVSSGGHLRSPVVFDDIDFAFRDYNPFAAYGQSKTANVLFAVEATRRWADDGITSNALMPGAIFDTALGRHVDAGHVASAAKQAKLKTVEQGAATSVLLAASPLLDGVGGRYFEDCTQARIVDRRGAPGTGGVARYAVDAGNAERLWDVSLRMAG